MARKVKRARKTKRKVSRKRGHVKRRAARKMAPRKRRVIRRTSGSKKGKNILIRQVEKLLGTFSDDMITSLDLKDEKKNLLKKITSFLH